MPTSKFTAAVILKTERANKISENNVLIVFSAHIITPKISKVKIGSAFSRCDSNEINIKLNLHFFIIAAIRCCDTVLTLTQLFKYQIRHNNK